MILSRTLSQQIVAKAYTYIDRPYDWHTFDCIHFIIDVYRDCGIEIPRFGSSGFPPSEFHLSEEEFRHMPIGHAVFFKRKASIKDRVWTHAGIIVSLTEVIHCSRHFGSKVVVTPLSEFIEIYRLAPKGK